MTDENTMSDKIKCVITNIPNLKESVKIKHHKTRFEQYYNQKTGDFGYEILIFYEEI